MIFKSFCAAVLLALGGCATGSAPPSGQCTSPTTYQCQVDMYMRAGG